ncbi:unnamed protein product [Sphagnum jensenii]|uniref:UVR domain-containing protein n=1 Tax=Sphagnum jensenii TaxID=128206 RepID=A0ABP0WLL4_9BRYO
MEEDERNSSDDMESLFAGMDFVAPAFSVSVLSTSSPSAAAAAAAAASPPPLSKDPTLSLSLEESVLPQGDLASVAPVLLSPSQQQQPRLTPSSSIHGFVFQPPGEPLDESLFSGLSLVSTPSDVTASQSAEVLEVIGSPSPSPPTPPLPPSAIVTSFVEDRNDEVKLERMSSMGSEESGTGDRDVSSVQSIMAAYNDVPPSSRSLPAGIPVAPIESIIETPHRQGGTAAGQNELTIEMKFNLIKQAIATKVKSLKERGLLVSAKRKDAAQKRRQAAEMVASESARHKDFEAQLEVACETEDFEKADDLSGKILESEKMQEEAVRVFTVAEVECDQIAAEMQEVLDLEIEIEEEGAQLLQALTKEAEEAMERVKLEAQGTARQGFNKLDAEEKTVQLERLKVSSELQLADEALRDLNNAVTESTKTKAEQKLLLMKKRELLDLELQELLAKVRAKELEISEADEHISEVDKEISMLEAATDQQHVATNTKVEGLRMALMELDTKSSSLTEQRDGLKAVLSDMEAEMLNLERLAKIAMADGLAMHEAMETKKGAAALISQSREKMMHLAAKEKQATEEVHALRQEALVARASLQEVVGVKVKLQQEMATAKQRILFVEKRGPELEAEKKLAASARNFKEAGRLAAEAKALMAEKEDLTGNIAQISSRIHALEEEGVAKGDALAEMDELVAVKEKEGAVARCERLRLLATAARHERDAAVDLDDLQEAENLEIEVEAAEQEADELQRLFNLEEQKYARVVEIPASGMGSKMREQPHGADEMFDISTEEAPEMKDSADEQPIEAENT